MSRRIGRTSLVVVLAVLAITSVLATSAGAAYRHPVSSASFGADGTSASSIGAPQQMAINQVTNTLYLISNEENKLFGFQIPAPATHTPVGGAFPLTVANGGGDGDLGVDSASGNIYYVSEGTNQVYGFSSSGAALPAPFPIQLSGDNCGLAVDKEGNFGVAAYGTGTVQLFTASGATVKTIDVSATGSPCHIEFNRANNDLYVATFSGGIYKYTAASNYTVHTQITSEPARGLAFDASTGILYATMGTSSLAGERVVAFNESGGFVETFGKTSSGGLRGIAVDEATGVVYADNEASGKVLAFPGLTVPDVTTGEPIANNVVSGHIDPAGGGEVISCRVEFGEAHLNTPPEYDSSVPCSPPTPYTSPTNVTAELPGVLGEHTYDYRFVASNSNPASATAGENRQITPHYVKALHTGAATELSRNCATLNGSFEGNGEDTHYYFEYGNTAKYGATLPDPPPADAGMGTGPQTESSHICGLEAGTTYHYRIVATNGQGTSQANDQTFQTVTAVENLTTEAATVPNASEAILHAAYLGNGEDTQIFFEWGFTTFYGNKTPEIDEGTKTGPVSFAATIGELFPDTTYHFRVVGHNATGFAYGQDLTFTTGFRPEVTLLPPMSNELADGTRVATLRGTVNPKNGESTSWHFEYGPTTSYGISTPPQGPLAADETAHPVSAGISGLTPGVIYHYRLVATSKEGTTRGDDSTFQAVPNLPTVIGSSVSGVSASAATVNATVVPGNGSTAVIIDYGTTEAYGKSTRAEGPTPSDEVAHTVSRLLTGLQPNTTYHYRVTAVNFAGTTHGPDQSFSTAGVPSILAQSATGITQTEARLTASISPNLISTAYHFEWGPKGSYGGASAESTPVGADLSSHPAETRVTGLTPGTTYQFRVVATNALGSTAGSAVLFTTAPAPAAKPPKCKKGSVLKKGKCVRKSKPPRHKKKHAGKKPTKHKGAKK